MSQESAATADESAAVDTGNLDRDALLLRFVKSIVDERYEKVLSAADAALLAEYADKDTTTVKPKFEGMVLGSRTVAEPKAKMAVTDVDAFTAWAASGNHGVWEFIVDTTWKNATLRYAKWDEAKQVAVTKHGEVIPGVTQLPAPPPSSVTQKLSPEAFAKLAKMLHEGQFVADLRALAPVPEDAVETA